MYVFRFGFNGAFDEQFEILGVSGIDEIETLTAVLLSQVVNGNVASTGLSNGMVSTLNPEKSMGINIDDEVVIEEDVNVVLVDIQGVNGIVHVIDKVIIPESFFLAKGILAGHYYLAGCSFYYPVLFLIFAVDMNK